MRAHGKALPAVVTLEGDRLVAQLRGPERGLAAGQAIVVYHDDTVLGSATIAIAT
jgi:tRNA-specific 2-thiouridylase